MTSDCQRLLEQLDAPSVSPELAEHLARCPDCRAVREAYREVEAPTREASAPLPTALAESVREAARAEVAQHPRARSWRVEAGRLAALCVAGGLAMALPIAWMQGHSFTARNALLSVLPLVVGGLGSYVGLAPGKHRLRQGLLAVAAMAAAVIALAGAPGVPLRSPGCALLESLAAILPVGLGIRALRESAFNATSAALVAASTSAVGVVAVQLSCPEVGRSHQLVFHLVPWLLVALAAWLGRRVARSESYAP